MVDLDSGDEFFSAVVSGIVTAALLEKQGLRSKMVVQHHRRWVHECLDDVQYLSSFMTVRDISFSNFLGGYFREFTWYIYMWSLNLYLPCLENNTKQTESSSLFT